MAGALPCVGLDGTGHDAVVSEVSTGKPWTPDQLKFQAWLALPSTARTPKQQRQLAAQLEVHEVTLSEWKRLPGFADAVYEMALEVVRADLAPVLHAHAKLALTNLDSAKWLFEVVGRWTPTTRNQHGNVPGEEFRVTVEPKPWKEALAPFMPGEDDDGSSTP